ncbi:hypothetical protein RHECNPAF_470066 [Rhizobium etli CNPAF512]|nr:hypothetical protein RHECNPAF_470066 [Rhizobium etli CNPAF512]
MSALAVAATILKARQRKSPATRAKKTSRNASDSGWQKIQTSFEIRNTIYSLGTTAILPIRFEGNRNATLLFAAHSGRAVRGKLLVEAPLKRPGNEHGGKRQRHGKDGDQPQGMGACQPRQDGAGDRAGDHAAPGHDLDRPFDTAIADDPAADAAAETRQRAGDIGQPDRQAFDMFDGGIHHAHGTDDQVKARKHHALAGRHRSERQDEADAAEHDEYPALGDMGDDDAGRIAEHENDNGGDQHRRMIKIAVAEGESRPRRVASHEGNEIAGQQQAGRIGHAGQKRDRADKSDPGQGASCPDDMAASCSGHYSRVLKPNR